MTQNMEDIVIDLLLLIYIYIFIIIYYLNFIKYLYCTSNRIRKLTYIIILILIYYLSPLSAF